ncbi:hypothetical protein [Nakamurella sp.]|uniref:glycerophosphodiester phosphodiesterase n=1 Tax=Nakamurella sp. TaxID=1869182 RepID=UPI003B3BA0E5
MPFTSSPVSRGPTDRIARTRRLRSGAVLAAAVLAGVAACGSGPVDPDPAPGSGVASAPTSVASTGLVTTDATAPAESVTAAPAPSGADTSGTGDSTGGADGPAASSPVRQWLAAPVVEIAHHGGSADWPPSSPQAYRMARDWNPALALEFSARRTADGVWVGSEDPTTGSVYGTDLTIATSTWDQLSSLRSLQGGQPMSRLETDLLQQLPATRVLFVDDKDDDHVGELLDLLDRYGGAGRTIIKSYWKTTETPTQAHRRGYLTWGYYYADEMDRFPSSQARFDLLGINFNAPPQVYAQMLATGKRVIAHVVATRAQADKAIARGATGLMVSGVQEVVPTS